MVVSRLGTLNRDPLNCIAEFVGNPAVLEPVAKRFRQEVSEHTYTQLWNAYLQKPQLARDVHKVTQLQFPTYAARVKAVYERIIAHAADMTVPVATASILDPDRLAALSKQSAEILCDFFCIFATRIGAALPQAQQFYDELYDGLEGRLVQKIAAIETWMEQHRVELSAITALNFYSCGLKYLPPQIGLFTGLTQLFLPAESREFLPDQYLVTLSAEIEKCTKLKILDLGGNRLTSMPRGIGRLTALEHLTLAGNQLTSLPAELMQCEQLTRLDLAENQLTDFPNIGQLNRLKALFLNGNRLTAFPAGIGQCTALEVFDISSNEITAIHPDLRQCAALRLLYISHNLIDLTQEEIHERLPPGINDLKLDGNPLPLSCWEQMLAGIGFALSWIWQGLGRFLHRLWV